MDCCPGRLAVVGLEHHGAKLQQFPVVGNGAFNWREFWSLVAADQGANFGPEMSVLANCFKAKLGADDVPFIYTVPAKSLAPKISQPKATINNGAARIIG